MTKTIVIFAVHIGDVHCTGILGIVISHHKDPYKPTSTMECHKSFEGCSSRLADGWNW